MEAPKTEPLSKLFKTPDRDRDRCFFKLDNVVAFVKQDDEEGSTN